MCPGLAPLGGSIPPPGFGFGCCCCSRATCNRPCLLCVRLWCYAPYRRRSECAVRCFRCLWVWGVLVALIKLAGFLVGLRLRASPSGFAFGLRLRASPSGPPEATTRLRTHGRTPGVVPGFTHPRHTAVVFAAERRRAAFWSVSCCTCCASPHGTLGAEHFLVVCFVGANDAGAASGGHLTFGRFASSLLHLHDGNLRLAEVAAPRAKRVQHRPQVFSFMGLEFVFSLA